MTDEKRHAALLAYIEEYTAANTATKADARATLIREGIYTEDGELEPEFGGPPKKAKTAA